MKKNSGLLKVKVMGDYTDIDLAQCPTNQNLCHRNSLWGTCLPWALNYYVSWTIPPPTLKVIETFCMPFRCLAMDSVLWGNVMAFLPLNRCRIDLDQPAALCGRWLEGLSRNYPVITAVHCLAFKGRWRTGQWHLTSNRLTEHLIFASLGCPAELREISIWYLPILAWHLKSPSPTLWWVVPCGLKQHPLVYALDVDQHCTSTYFMVAISTMQV